MYSFKHRIWRLVGPVALLSGLVLPCRSQAAGAISFLPPVTYDVPGSVGDRLPMVVDLDGDGKNDVEVTGPDRFAFFYGNGDGTFAPRVDELIDGAGWTTAADVDGDGRLDLIFNRNNTVCVRINQGQRHFAPLVSYPVGTTPTGVLAADFNGDGKPDLAVANYISANMCVLLNHGDGTFAAAVFYPGGDHPARLVSADFNGDGKPDLAMSNYVSDDLIVYFGDGQGRFTVGGRYPTGGAYPAMIVTNDFNRDGKPDLATANTFGNSISVFLGDGHGGFSGPAIYGGNQDPHIMASADLDGDGAPDLVAPNAAMQYFTVLQNTGDGTFLAPVTVAAGGIGTRLVAIGDLNGDGKPDVVTGNMGSNNISVLINSSPSVPPLPTAGDLLVTSHDTQSVLRYNGRTGAFVGALIPSGANGPGPSHGLLFGPDGNLYVGDVAADAVRRYNGVTGAFIDVFVAPRSGGLDQPAGMLFGPDGNLYVSSYFTNRVLRFDGHSGAYLGSAGLGGLQGPSAISFGPDGNLYVASELTHSVLRYNGVTGVFIDAFVASGSGGLDHPDGMLFGPDGNLYVSSYTRSTVLRYNGSTGAFIDTFVPAGSGGLDGATNIRMGPDQNLYVVSQNNNRVLRYNGSTGAFIDTFVAPGSGGLDGATDLAFILSPPLGLPTLAAPTNLALSAASLTQINLTWADHSDNETGFEVQRQVQGGHWTPVATVLPNTTQYADRGLTPFTTYLYRVRSFNAQGTSAWWSNVAWADTARPPAAPTGLTVSPASMTQLDLTWTDNSSAEFAFEVWRQIGAGAFTRIATLPPNTTRYSNTGLSPSTSYSYRVKVTGAEGAAWSNTAAGTTPRLTPPLPPLNLRASLGSVTRINLSWTDRSDTETTFEIQRHEPGGPWAPLGSAPANATSYADTSVTPLHTYIYRVRAVNAAGPSPWWSNEAWTDTVTPPVPPQNLALAVASPTRINLTWTDRSGNETSFEVQRQVPGGPWTPIGSAPANATSYADTSVSPASTYLYRVRAVNAAGPSPWWSNVAWADTVLPPAAPTDLQLRTASPAQIVIAWTDNSADELAFEVWRKSATSGYQRIDSLAPNVTVYIDRNLTPGATYTYRIRATGAMGASAWTNEVNWSVPPGPENDRIALVSSA